MNDNFYKAFIKTALLKASNLRNTKKILARIKDNPAARDRILKQLGVDPSHLPPNYSLHAKDIHMVLKARSQEALGKSDRKIDETFKRIGNVAATGSPEATQYEKIKGAKKRVTSKTKFYASDTDMTKAYRGLLKGRSKNPIDMTRPNPHFTPSISAAAEYGPYGGIMLEVDKKKLPQHLRKKFSRSGPDYTVDPEGKVHSMEFVPRRRNIKPGEKQPKGYYDNRAEMGASGQHGLHPRYEQRYLGSLSELPKGAIKTHYIGKKGGKIVLTPIKQKPGIDPKQQKLLSKKA